MPLLFFALEAVKHACTDNCWLMDSFEIASFIACVFACTLLPFLEVQPAIYKKTLQYNVIQATEITCLLTDA